MHRISTLDVLNWRNYSLRRKGINKDHSQNSLWTWHSYGFKLWNYGAFGAK